MKNKITKSQQQKEMRKFQRKALSLWKIVVKLRAGGKCEDCGETKFLNACHVESFERNFNLRYSISNGIALCPRHHKWDRRSFHRSFVFTYLIMVKKHPKELNYLMDHFDDKNEKLTRTGLLRKIKELEKLKEELECDLA